MILAAAVLGAATSSRPLLAKDCAPGSMRFQRARQAIETLMAESHLPSVAVAVAQHGCVWEEAFGWSDAERKVPATPHTSYWLGSISKPFAATALMRLVEQGKIRLEAPANDYLGAAKLTARVGDAGQATVERLLTHSAGLPLHYHFFYRDEDEPFLETEETIRRYGIIVMPPGERYYYSNLGYGIVSHMISRVAGASYADHMRREVFEPLGLSDSAIGVPSGQAGRVAVRYDKGGVPVPNYTFDTPGASAVVASAHDLVRFGMFHLKQRVPRQRRVISEASRDSMQRNHVPEGPPGLFRGLGWGIDENDFGYRLITHTGSMPGATAGLYLYPSEGLAVVVLINKTSGKALTQIARELVSSVLPRYGERWRAAPAAKPAPLSWNLPGELAGTWRGTIQSWTGSTPIVLELAADGPRASLPDGTRLVVTDPAVDDGFVLLTIELRLSVPEAARHDHKIFLRLYPRDGDLVGFAGAFTSGARLYYALSYYAEFSRDGAGPGVRGDPTAKTPPDRALSPTEVAEDIAFVRSALETRFAYFFRDTPDYQTRLQEITERARNGMTTTELGLELTQLLALFRDSHAVVRGYDFPEGTLPCLLEPLGDRFIAFKADRSGFVGDGHPFVVAIDGRAMAEWQVAARQFIARGSPAYIAVQTSGILRHINLMRRVLGVPAPPTVTLQLGSEDGRSIATVTLPLAKQAAAAGAWPETTSRMLDDAILYLRLPSMNADAAAALKSWIPRFGEAAGVIVDVRGNVGGSRQALAALLPHLLPPDEPARVVNVSRYRLASAFAEDHLAARSLYRADWPGWSADERAAIERLRASFQAEWSPPDSAFSDWHYMVLSRPTDSGFISFRGPVMVLMDRRNFSATDVFLSALKGSPNVILVGMPTSGGSSFTRAIETPNAKLDLHLGSMVSFQRDGRLYDGAGVDPDVRIESLPEFVLRGGRDIVLEHAVQLIHERQAASQLGRRPDVDSGGLRYVRVPAGDFWMGCVPGDTQCDEHENPRHRVRLTRAYWMSTTEVTVDAFRRFVRATGHRTFAEREGRGRMFSVTRDQWEWVAGLSWERPLDPKEKTPEDWPVAQVEPADAEAYCRWAGGRLPTEAEWERAARGGREDERFPWGNESLPRVGGRSFANGPDAQTKNRIPQWQTFDGYDDGFAMLAPVARFAPNAYGLHDMAGNVYEWSADRYDATAYATGPRIDPRGPTSGDSRVVRGGGWGYYPYHLRSSFRGYFPEAGFPTATVGFRCVRDDH